MKRICAGVPGKPCGLISDKNRCPDCARKYEIHRGPRTMKGRYDAQWRRIRAQAIREHPWCSVCKHPGSPDNPLTGDHITPHRLGGRNVRSNVQVLCRACNSRKGGSENKGGGVLIGGRGSKYPPR
jgi:5-methylcytosine-specific restriction protein A